MPFNHACFYVSVLAHCRHSDAPVELPVLGTMPSLETSNRATEFNHRVKLLLEHFDEASQVRITLNEIPICLSILIYLGIE